MLNNRKRLILFTLIFAAFQNLVFLLMPLGAYLFSSDVSRHFTILEYGMLFLPATVTTIFFSLWGGQYAYKWGIYSLFVFGILGNIIAVFLVGAAIFTFSLSPLSYLFFLGALFVMGVGSGCCFMIVTYVGYLLFKNRAWPFTALFSTFTAGGFITPFLFLMMLKKQELWILNLNFLFILFFLVADLLGVFQVKAEREPPSYAKKSVAPFVGALFCFGLIETTILVWTSIYLTEHFHLSSSRSTLLLSCFWIAMTAGRLLIPFLPLQPIFRWFPLIVAALATLLFFSQNVTTTTFLLILLGLAESCLIPYVLIYVQRFFGQRAIIFAGIGWAGFWAAYGIGNLLFAQLQNIKLVQMEWHFILIAVASVAAFICTNNIIKGSIIKGAKNHGKTNVNSQ